MIEGILAEQRLSLTELAHREGVSPVTVWRWATRGIRGVQLESYRRGGKRFTSHQAYARWVGATQGDRPAALAPRTNRSRDAAVNAAERELDAAGI
jgi:hypothetical protein